MEQGNIVAWAELELTIVTLLLLQLLFALVLLADRSALCPSVFGVDDTEINTGTDSSESFWTVDAVEFSPGEMTGLTLLSRL